MIKAETIGNGVSISIDGDGETMQREFLGIVTTITETLIEEENIRFTYYKDEKGGIWFDDEPEGGKPEWMQRADRERRKRKRHS